MDRGQSDYHGYLFRCVIMPNGSMSPRLGVWFFASLALLTGVLAAGFWLVGAWLIAPFSGLELAALGAALIYIEKQNQYREVVSVTEELIRVESGIGGPTRVREFPRYWARVRLESSSIPTHPARLLIVSHGKAYELGACLTEDQRRSLASRLGAAVGPLAA
ncbi:MAG TPA: DUF2244 domain-containing protein [Gammaproteobacteria bacterium]|nr:DUF2244 domain-containing protein [Gammaproteobacteria bacterium]